MLVQFLDLEEPLEKGTATYSSILAWRIPCTEKPGRLQSMDLQSQTQLSDELENLRRQISVAENLLRDETISSIKEFC